VSDSSGRVQVVSKAMLRKRGGVSPDRAEAFCWRCMSLWPRRFFVKSFFGFAE
jgi:hypothetical protein